MQAIARANRVSVGKSNGLVIDYIGIVKALRKALADYTTNKEQQDGEDPTVDKEKLFEKILEIISRTKEFLNERGFNLQEMIDCRANNFKRIELLLKAADCVCVSVKVKKTFETYASELLRLIKFVCKKDMEPWVFEAKDAIEAIYKELQKKAQACRQH